MTTDPIADMLTRMRNAMRAQHISTTVPSSNIKKAVLQVMKEKNIIDDFEEVSKGPTKKILTIQLKSGKDIVLRRISKPGQRIYKKAHDLHPVLQGYGWSILSTSEGVMTGHEAKKKGIGGEVICEIF
jgi:small subunit ribosomal protein S8